ncbi:hypothetical protein QYM36_005611 [Artemia franciscana]|uniref:Reverse transcriptase domain-containing protein n=1 Tax=Artemia franciscana TaxID=6661 RepID=A0AA88IAN7_ARTSF|nr:hypothetical protein QYM36_005611 [Artemia franciscana]
MHVQQKMSSSKERNVLLRTSKGCAFLVDDNLIYGRAQKEHDNRLEEVLKQAKKYNIKYNKSKCQFGLEKVHYFALVISKDGIKPYPEKLLVINDMPNIKLKKSCKHYLEC